MTEKSMRKGDEALGLDPAKTANDARLIFIGRIRTPWTSLKDCPRNPGKARERGATVAVEVEPVYRAALGGLENCSHVLLLYWLDRARRDLVIQKRREGKTLKTFATRSPVRPNPIGVAAVRLLKLDIAAGRLDVDAIDCIDGTPLLDIKPYIPSVDAFPDASLNWPGKTG